MSAIELRGHIREVEDFPTPGVGFKDTTPLLADPAALKHAISCLASWVVSKQVDLIVGAEAGLHPRGGDRRAGGLRLRAWAKTRKAAP